MKMATSDIRTVKAIHPENGRSVVFVDTPGFDVSDKSDTETLKQIFDWLVET
jgi:GTPase Era involved in 16S rRNA processing